MDTDRRQQQNQQPAMTDKARCAIRRLYRDWKEMEAEHLPTVVALPTSNMLVWHCNLRPDYGPFAGTIIHLVLNFPETYPHSPPSVKLCTYLGHPNVFGDWICLDMIEEYYTDEPYTGWTSAYSILSLLLQLQSFLFAENIPQDWGGKEPAHDSERSMVKTITAARRFCFEIETHDGAWVEHSHINPWPPLPHYTGTLGYQLPLAGGRGRVGRQKKDSKVTLSLQPEVQFSKEQQVPLQYSSTDFPPLAGGMEIGDSLEVPCLPSAGQERSPPSPVALLSSTAVHTTVFFPPLAGGTEEGDSLEVPCSASTANHQERFPSPAALLPSAVYTNVFSFLDAKELLRARDVCTHWRRVIFAYNLFERSQITCFHSKVTLDDNNTILGIGLKVEYYPDGTTLKAVSSPLDMLSFQAFEEEGVRTGVWGGRTEAFTHFLPLIFNAGHAAKAVTKIEKTVYDLMKKCTLPNGDGRQQLNRRAQRQIQRHNRFHPYMIFQLLAVLMNSMVVELMNSAEGNQGGRGRGQSDIEIHRHASEKALEGYCAFHHMLLFFAKRYPVLIELANKQVNLFLSSEKFRHKHYAPNLGVLLICLTLSQRGWNSLRKPLVMEVFDRNVRWLLQKHGTLSRASLPADKRLEWTFTGARTSLRLLMFQVYFMFRIGRPVNTAGPWDVLDQYEKRLGKPTTAQKEDLQRNAKDIMAVTTWDQFFLRLGEAGPTMPRLVAILKQAVGNSEKKRYHRW